MMFCLSTNDNGSTSKVKHSTGKEFQKDFFVLKMFLRASSVMKKFIARSFFILFLCKYFDSKSTDHRRSIFGGCFQFVC